MFTTGGIENHLVKFCENIHADGGIIDFVCADYRLGTGLDQRLRSVVDTIIVQAVSSRTPGWAKLAWTFFAAFAIFYRRYTSVYINGQGNMSWLFSALVCGLSDRCILHHHSSGDLADREGWPLAYRYLVARADVVLACSQKNAVEIGEAYDRRIDVIYCFTDQLTPRINRQAKRVRFGFLGRLIPEKGIGVILSLARVFPDVEWHLWGANSYYAESEFESCENLYYHGQYSSSSEQEYALSLIDCIVLFTTHSEGLPLMLLEAMGAGKPWIAADRGGVVDLRIDDVNTIVIPRDFSLQDAEAAVSKMIASLSGNKICATRLIDVYDKKFRREELVKRWRAVLGYRDVEMFIA